LFFSGGGGEILGNEVENRFCLNVRGGTFTPTEWFKVDLDTISEGLANISEG